MSKIMKIFNSTGAKIAAAGGALTLALHQLSQLPQAAAMTVYKGYVLKDGWSQGDAPITSIADPSGVSHCTVPNNGVLYHVFDKLCNTRFEDLAPGGRIEYTHGSYGPDYINSGIESIINGTAVPNTIKKTAAVLPNIPEQFAAHAQPVVQEGGQQVVAAAPGIPDPILAGIITAACVGGGLIYYALTRRGKQQQAALNPK